MCIRDRNVTKQRNLNFFAFSVQSGPKEFVELQSMGMDYLKQMGFSPVSGKTCRTEEEVLDAIKEIEMCIRDRCGGGILK